MPAATYPGVRAGQLRDRVMIQKRADSQDDTGEMVPTFTDFAAAWADIQPIEGLRGMEIESLIGKEILSSAIYRVIIRFVAGLTTMDRLIVIGPPDQPFEILSLQDMDGRRRKISMICRGGVSSG